MKLKYKIAKVSDLNSETIIKKILLKIEQKKYGIVDITPNSVSFNDHTGGIVYNWEYARRMKGGKFEIVNNTSSNVVIFEYYPIPVSEFIWVGLICLIPIVFGIINQVYLVGLISCLFLGQLIFKHFNLKVIANDMLSDIVNSNTNSDNSSEGE